MEVRQVHDLREFAEEMLATESLRSVPIEDLKGAFGVERLGGRIRSTIVETLDHAGIGVYPESLDGAEVRLYRKKSPVGSLINAVLSPGETGDRVLSKFGQSTERSVEQKALDDIRAIIHDLYGA